MYAATFTPGWAGLTTLVTTLGAVVLTNVLNQRGERRREKAAEQERAAVRDHEQDLRAADRAHERVLREAEMRDAHRSRLYSDRRAGYAEFYSAYLEYRRAQEDASIAWGHRSIVAREVRTRPPEDLDYAGRLWDSALERSAKARASLEPALMRAELVASPPVRDAAAELRDLAFEAEKRSMKHASVDMNDSQSLDLWDALQEAEKAVQVGERRLREAIQAEMELDR